MEKAVWEKKTSFTIVCKYVRTAQRGWVTHAVCFQKKIVGNQKRILLVLQKKKKNNRYGSIVSIRLLLLSIHM